jgi:ABC-type transport system involved in cytochrome c biogenesis permease component
MRVKMLNAIMILTLVMSPVLIPMLISGVHVAAGWRRKYRPHPKSFASEGRAVPR